MFWAVVIIAIIIIGFCMDSDIGKIILVAGVIALGMLLLTWITGIEIFVTLAKICAVIIILIIIGVIINIIIKN